MKTFCSSCKLDVVNVAGAARFLCPNCMKYEIVRCPHCRKIAAHYKCPGCGFEGPN